MSERSSISLYLSHLWIKSKLGYRDIAKMAGLSEKGVYRILSGDVEAKFCSIEKLLYVLNSNFTDYETWIKERL